MKLEIAWIQAKRSRDKLSGITQLTAEYIARLKRHIVVEVRQASDAASALSSSRGRTKAFSVLLDSRGKQLSSGELAELLNTHQQRGTQRLLFVVGGAEGFTPEQRGAADLVLSLGKITLPHELARVVLLEQLYRAFTIVKGHPYHIGH